MGVAGLRRGDEARELIDALGLAGVALPVAVYSDARAALRAGTPGDGVVVVAGTGVAAYGRRGDSEARAGGWGSALGDEGGAFWMVASMVRTALRALDEGDLTGAGILPAVLTRAGLTDAEPLRRLAGGADGVARLSALLPAVALLREKGHPVADSLLAGAVQELARLARLVAGRLDLPTPYPLVLAGGMAAAFPDLAGTLETELAGAAGVTALAVDPAWGAYLLAREDNSWVIPEAAAEATTERPNSATANLRTIPTVELLRRMNAEDALVAPAVAACIPTLARLVDETVRRMRRGGRLIYAGAGTSGRLAMLDAVECVPTFGIDADRVVALIAGGEAALTSAVEGAEDDADAGEAAIDRLRVSSRDTIVGISASGGARYVLAALARARQRDGATALVTCNPAAATLADWDLAIVAEVGPEVITGSTRLKAGTAQKLILNMLSTAIMVGLGRTAGNRMIGVRPTNAKLRERALRLTADLSGEDSERVRAALDACGWDVTAAVLTLRTGDPARARAILAKADGDLARALQLEE
jgi:N-acetylmuramic acid 6-phosphate etherase